MKNLKAIVLIILGAFFLATVFAFGAETTAYGQLRGGAFGSRPAGMPTISVNKAAEAGPFNKSGEASPKPSFKERVSAVMAPLKRPIASASVGALIGFCLVGTVAGALTGGLFAVIFVAMAYM